MLFLLLVCSINAQEYILDNNINSNIIYIRTTYSFSSLGVIQQTCQETITFGITSNSGNNDCCNKADIGMTIEHNMLYYNNFESTDSYIVVNNYRIGLINNPYIYKL